MRIVFFDHCGFPYHAGMPFERPLGGSQSALCYLALELVQRGHEVTLYTPIAEPVTVRGVPCRPNHTFLAAHMNEPLDAMVFLNGPAEVAQKVRQHLRARTPLLLWTQHAVDQDAMLPLADPVVRASWDGVICISAWQRHAVLERFGFDPARVGVMPNAVAPFFRRLFASRDEFVAMKSGPPVLAYTSTPFRGLNVLLSAFPLVRARHPAAELRIYSSMAVYQRDEGEYRRLYDWCRTTPGVNYVGSLPQAELAGALRAASVLAYPNTFPETYCTAAAEALAAGLHVITSDLGALPETTAGFGTLVRGSGRDDLGPFARNFVEATCAVLDRRAANPLAFAETLYRQVEAAEARCTWTVRAAEWERLLASAAGLLPGARA